MAIDDTLRQVVDVVNDLSNFVPFGVLFVYNWPGLPCPGIKIEGSINEYSDWNWLDFPYTENDGLSPILDGLRLLVRRVYARLSYKIFEGIAIIRVYLMPHDSKFSNLLTTYRERYFRFKKTLQWLEKRCLLVISNLMTVMDFTGIAFNLNAIEEVYDYLKRNKFVLVSVLDKGDSGIHQIQGDEFNFHVHRFMNSLPFDDFIRSTCSVSSLQARLNNIYSKISSPITKRDYLAHDDDQLVIYDAIMNNEIEGFKSILYNFQKRSVLKMFEKESIRCPKIMPNVVYTKQKCYFDLKKLLPMENPPLLEPPRGGILAESMGLGKTCICLALICISKFEVSEIPPIFRNNIIEKKDQTNSLVDMCVKFINQNSIPWREYYDDFPSNITEKLESSVGYFEKYDIKNSTRSTRSNLEDIKISKYYLSSTTLIVLPDNLFHQWKVEIHKHVEKEFLKILEIQSYHQMEIVNLQKICEIVNNDIVLISNNVFSRQVEVTGSILKKIYWKRLIIDEGHSMNSKTSRSVALTKDLMYERMWVISGTPTSGLTSLHMENESTGYNIQKHFDPKQDLTKLGIMISNFFKIEPYVFDKKLWSELIIKPFEKKVFNIDYELFNFLSLLIIRHNIADVENDIKLPKLHHRPIFLKPSFFDKLSINLFVAVLATNAVTSERTGADYMFDRTNKSDLRRLINNLQKGTFYWTGFTISDIENLLNISVYSLRENNYNEEDIRLLEFSIFISKLALSNLRWRTVTTVHEMGYFVKNLTKEILENYSLVHYADNVSVFGYSHLTAIQKLFYKNRVSLVNEKILKQSALFWKQYWANIKNSKHSGNHLLNINEDYKKFELEDVKVISETPNWVNTFNPKLEESILYSDERPRNKKQKVASVTNSEPFDDEKIDLRCAQIVGTLSSKLNYLTSRLLENQMKGMKSIVFYEFENSAYYLTEFLDLLGMNFIMYSTYIKISDRSNNLAKFDRWDILENDGQGIALIMDLKLASHGLTIIEATQIFFINPVWNQSVEAQAIKRSHRIGQTKEVFVETLILENTLEEEMYRMRSETSETMDENVELIEHSQIKDYILKFPFLRMFMNENNDEEFDQFRFSSPYIGTVSKLEDHETDDGIRLPKISDTYDSRTNLRLWHLPLFTESNLERIWSSSKKNHIRFDDIESLENDERVKTERNKSVELMRFLCDKRNSKKLRKLNVRFNL